MDRARARAWRDAGLNKQALVEAKAGNEFLDLAERNVVDSADLPEAPQHRARIGIGREEILRPRQKVVANDRVGQPRAFLPPCGGAENLH